MGRAAAAAGENADKVWTGGAAESMGLGRKKRPGERHWLRAGGQECRRVCGGLRRPCAVRSCAAAAAAGWVVVVGMCEQGKGAVEGARPQALLPNRMMSCRENAARREGGAGVCVRENRAIAMFLPSSRPTRREREKWWGQDGSPEQIQQTPNSDGLCGPGGGCCRVAGAGAGRLSTCVCPRGGAGAGRRGHASTKENTPHLNHRLLFVVLTPIQCRRRAGYVRGVGYERRTGAAGGAVCHVSALAGRRAAAARRRRPGGRQTASQLSTARKQQTLFLPGPLQVVVCEATDLASASKLASFREQLAIYMAETGSQPSFEVGGAGELNQWYVRVRRRRRRADLI